jgi:hypothetical protein
VKPETNLNFGFVILSPDHHMGRLQTSISSLKSQYPDASYICVTGEEAPAEDVTGMEKICPVFRGKKTITSLVNAGVENGHKEWNVFVVEGAFVAKGTIRKLFFAIKNKKDIVFPIVVSYDRQGKPVELRAAFYNSTLNGLSIHRDTFREVGNLTDNPLEVSKLFWADMAHEKGCQFKAVLGARII